MGDWQQSQDNHRVTITTVGDESVGREVIATNVTFSPAAWPVANLAVFVPFVVAAPFTAMKMSVLNGAVVNGNFDLGIYDSGQNRLVSMGSTAQTGTTAIQTVDITDTVLLPGEYYAALCSSSATATFMGATLGAAAYLRAFGVLEQAVGAVTLPDPAVFAAATHLRVPFISVHGRALI